MAYTRKGPFVLDNPPVFDTPEFLNGLEDWILDEGEARLANIELPPIVSYAASFTFAAADMGKYVHASSASAIVATVPPNASEAIAVNSFAPLVRMGAGTVTVAAGAGVTIHSAGGLLAVSAQYAEVGLRKIATDEWLLTGSLS